MIKKITEPVVVFVKNAAGGRKLADEKNWYFCDGSASIAAMTALAFQTGLKNGIVVTYPFAAMGLDLSRPDNSVILVGNPSIAESFQATNTAGILVGNPSIAESFQATNTAGIRTNLFGFNTGPVYSFKSIDQLQTRLDKHNCRCLIQTLNARGCQCGGK